MGGPWWVLFNSKQKCKGRFWLVSFIKIGRYVSVRVVTVHRLECGVDRFEGLRWQGLQLSLLQRCAPSVLFMGNCCLEPGRAARMFFGVVQLWLDVMPFGPDNGGVSW